MLLVTLYVVFQMWLCSYAGIVLIWTIYYFINSLFHYSTYNKDAVFPQYLPVHTKISLSCSQSFLLLGGFALAPQSSDRRLCPGPQRGHSPPAPSSPNTCYSPKPRVMHKTVGCITKLAQSIGTQWWEDRGKDPPRKVSNSHFIWLQPLSRI